MYVRPNQFLTVQLFSNTSLAFLDSLVHGGRTEVPTMTNEYRELFITMTTSDVLLKD